MFRCRVLYDNTRIAVGTICGDGRRERTRAFTELISHYLFRDRFGRPGKGNDKGSCLRQRKSWLASNPAERAISEAEALGSSASATSRSFSASAGAAYASEGGRLALIEGR